MNAEPDQEPTLRPVSRAAELAAEQVESIVSVAQESALKLTRAAQEEADSVRALARESAAADVESARKEASARLRDAQQAADEVLAQAKAVSGGLTQLAHLLTTHAERILRDVTNSHRALTADLRAAARNEPIAAADDRGAEEPDEPRDRPRTRRPGAGQENPFADLEPPSWVEN